jgi:hypothetical protein
MTIWCKLCKVAQFGDAARGCAIDFVLFAFTFLSHLSFCLRRRLLWAVFPSEYCCLPASFSLAYTTSSVFIVVQLFSIIHRLHRSRTNDGKKMTTTVSITHRQNKQASTSTKYGSGLCRSPALYLFRVAIDALGPIPFLQAKM